MDLADLIDHDPIDLDKIATFLDELHHEGRVAAIRSLSGKQQARLFDAADGYRKISLEDFVPPCAGELEEIVHHGKNSLPAASLFEKRFTRPPAGHVTTEIWGYNHQPMKTYTGPGYFVAYELPESGEVLIDYTRTPPAGAPLPDGWPKIIPNSKRLSRFIYNGTQDVMRGVSEHVTVGRASRDGEPMPNYFALCRTSKH